MKKKEEKCCLKTVNFKISKNLTRVKATVYMLYVYKPFLNCI